MAAVWISVALGCDRKSERSTTAETADASAEELRRETILTGARIESRDYVAGRLSDARCAREATCMDIGEGKRFATSDACVADLRREAMDHLAKTACPHGVDPRSLEQCIGAIRNEVCPRVLEQLDHLPECRGANICSRGAQR
jgi:hypothetical protein